jgi:ABC-type glycerol-3-phosphate transport system substrate-binding protein
MKAALRPVVGKLRSVEDVMGKRLTTVLLFLAAACGLLFAEGVKVSYMTWYTQGEEKQLLDKFMQENPAITVEVEGVDGSKYGEILKMRMTAGDLPDFITCKQNFVEMLMREGWALNLAGEPSVKLLDRAPAVKEALTYGGKIYSFPHEAGVGYGLMYYNKLIFKKLGLPVPFVPKTMNELEAAFDVIAKAGVEPVLFGAKDFWVTGFFTLRWFESSLYGSIAAKNGGKLIEPNAAYYKGIAKPSDGLRFAFETLKKWQDRGWVSKNSLSMTWPESFAYFAAGNAAVFPQGSWVPGMDETKNADPAVLDLGCFYMPQKSVDGKNYASGYVDKMLMVNAKAKQLAGAKKLLNWMASEPNLVYYLNYRKMGSFILPLNGLAPQPVFADYAASLKALKPVTILTVFPNVPGDEHTNLGQFSQAVLVGKSVNEALANADAFYLEHKPEIKVPER